MARRNSVDQIVHLDKFQCEAMMAGITRKLQQEFNMTNQANEFRDFAISAGRSVGAAQKGARRSVRKEAEEEYLESTSSRGVRAYAGGDHASYHRRPRAEEYLSQSELGIPSFHGKIDPEAYQEWEEEIEWVFSYHHYTEAKKIKLATSGFSGYAIHWWDQIASTRRHNGEPQITSWFEMKIVMKKRFAPDYNQFNYVQASPRQRKSQERTNGSRSERSKAVRSSQGRRPSSHPSPIQWTRQEQLCYKEKPALQQPKTNHSSPICKGKKENSNLKDFPNESFMYNYRKQIPRRLFVEGVENNNEEKNEAFEASSSPNEATVSRRLFGTEKFSNDSITGKCVLPSSQIDFVLKGTEICRELTPFEPVNPSSFVFFPQDFEEDAPGEIPKKVPPASGMELSGDARDAFKVRGGEEKPDPLPNSPKSETSLAEGESMDHENKLPEETSRRLFLDRNLAPTASWRFKPFTHSFIEGNRLKICKDIGVPSSLPSLFVIVTPDEEKRFGLENVNELCVSGIVFDKMVQSLEAPKYETISRSESSLFSEVCEPNLALSHDLSRKTFGNDQDLMFDECFPKLGYFPPGSNKMLHDSNLAMKGCETLCCEDFWDLKPDDMNSSLRENVFGSLSKLDHEFALLELWFRNMSELLRAKRRSEFEYVDTASKLAQSNLFASNYISLFGLCSKEKLCSSECSNARMIYDLILDDDSRSLNLIFKVLNLENLIAYFCCTFDVVFLVFVKMQDRQVMEFVPRTRRIRGLDKQVDYGPRERLNREWHHEGASVGRPQQSYQFGDWLWNHTWRPPSIAQGKCINSLTSNVSDSILFAADESDLRSNPFKGGGDGAITDGPSMDKAGMTVWSSDEGETEGGPECKGPDLCNELELELDQKQPMDVELDQTKTIQALIRIVEKEFKPKKKTSLLV